MPPTLKFTAGSSTVVTNSLVLAGNSAVAVLRLRSGTAGLAWALTPPTGTTLGGFLDVADSQSALLLHSGASSVESGNNANWAFP